MDGRLVSQCQAQSFPPNLNKLKTCLRVTLTFSFVSPLRSQNDSNPVVEVAVGHLAGCLLDPKARNFNFLDDA